VSDVEGTWMLLDRLKNTDSANVVTTSQVNSGTVDKLDHARDLIVSQVHLERIANANVWVRESEGSAVVRGGIWDLLLANILLDNLAELEASFLGVNSVWNESSFNIKQHSEELVGFFNCNNVHLTEWEPVVSPNSAVDLDEALLLAANLQTFLSRKGIFQSLLQQYVQWYALTKLVWTCRWSRTVHTFKLSKIPVLGASHSFHNLSLTFIALNLKTKLASCVVSYQ